MFEGGEKDGGGWIETEDKDKKISLFLLERLNLGR